jgi:hypothetical protein
MRSANQVCGAVEWLPHFFRLEENMKFWHWVVIVVVIFICINVYMAGTLKSLPLVGGYASQ